MTGSGNDFIVMDNREGVIQPEIMSTLAMGLCCRRRSLGADGLIILSMTDREDPKLGPVDFKWDFFNSDGSSAEMCGNGGRCAARAAHDWGFAGPEMVFDTLAGPIRASVQGSTVKLEMVPPFGEYAGLELEIEGNRVILEGINTGVPHAVMRVDDIESVPVTQWGAPIRFHQHFAPAGTNANFAARKGDELMVRTYERGVEDETLACGTGVVAAAITAGRGLGLTSPITARVRSGETLKVYYSDNGGKLGEVFLEGMAAYVYEAVLHREAFAWLNFS
jgi:diaminopimelate epimerase